MEITTPPELVLKPESKPEPPSKEATRKKPGRPLSFDRERALEQAMLVFWQYGYETTSLNDLTSAMGITPPSLYGAFGDKEKLFLEAVRRYTERHHDKITRALAETPNARDAVRQMLENSAVEHTCPDHPPGCMMATAVMNCSATSAHLQPIMAELKEHFNAHLIDRLQRAIDEGELPAATDPTALAYFYLTVLNGMTAQARDGASRKQLQDSAAMAMNAWPVPG